MVFDARVTVTGAAVTRRSDFHSWQMRDSRPLSATGSVIIAFRGPELTPSKKTTSVKTTAVFLQPFELESFNETLPAGEYQIESDSREPADGFEPGTWAASVLLRLHPAGSHPGLTRTLTVPLAELQRAVAKDKLTGKALTDFFLVEMISDPMIRLVMKADGVPESEIRDLYGEQSDQGSDPDGKDRGSAASSDAAGAETKGPLQGPTRPGRGE